MIRSLAGFMFATFLLVGPGTSLAQDTSAPMSAAERAALFPSHADLQQGRALAEKSCATCHGLDGISASEHQPHLGGQRTVYLYRKMLAYQRGERPDETMRNAVMFLDSDALLKTAIYYASLAPHRSAADPGGDRPLPPLNEDPLKATRAATSGCASCHGETGNSTMPAMPNLTAQHPDYFVAAMQAYQDGSRPNSMMRMLVGSLDATTLANMGLFYALQAPARTAAAGDGDAEAGRIAAEACANCHGADGNVDVPDMPTLAGQDAAYLVSAMQAYRNGQRPHEPMNNAMAEVGDVDIQNLATFYAQQTPRARRVRKPLTTAEWIERCNRCHGPQGNSTDPRIPALAGQNEAYLLKVLGEYASDERDNRIMHAMSEPLGRMNIDRLAAYYARQEPRSIVYVDLPCEDNE